MWGLGREKLVVAGRFGNICGGGCCADPHGALVDDFGLICTYILQVHYTFTHDHWPSRASKSCIQVVHPSRASVDHTANTMPYRILHHQYSTAHHAPLNQQCRQSRIPPRSSTHVPSRPHWLTALTTTAGHTTAALALAASMLTGGMHAPPPAHAITTEQLLYLEAWRAVDRAYYDKSFNNQNWFKVGLIWVQCQQRTSHCVLVVCWFLVVCVESRHDG